MLVLNLPFKALMFLTLMRPSLVLFLVLWLKLVKDFLKVRCRLALLPFLISCLIWLDLMASLPLIKERILVIILLLHFLSFMLVSVLVGPRLALRSSGGRSIWHRAHFSCLACIVRGCRVHPGRRVIAIHRVRRTIVPPDTPARRRRISGGAISATVISTLRWTIRAMLCFPFVARCHP